MKRPRQSPIEKSRDNPRSLRLAIRAMCWSCQGGYSDPGVVDRIRSCEITICALFNVRPYRDKGEDGLSPNNAIKRRSTDVPRDLNSGLHIMTEAA